MDGSPHDWFEGHRSNCTLLLAIDDATSRVTSVRFEEAETTNGYFRLITDHIQTYGRFRAAYTDKHRIFRYSGSSTDSKICTQIQRALDELDIELVCANSPQAKGRVERANRTFQDRLIKATRLHAICEIANANVYLPQFIAEHNARFAKQPALNEGAHRSASELDLPNILCRHEERIVTKNLMFQVDDDFFALTDSYSRRMLSVDSRITIHQHPDDRMTVYHGNHELVADRLGKRVRVAPIVGSKDLNAHLDRRIPDSRYSRLPAANHPWRTYSKPPTPV